METLLCARCGGPLPRAAANEVVTCSFCGTSAAPGPRVVEKIIERVQIVEVEARAEKHLPCPRCGGALHEPGTLRGGSLWVCRPCGGAWVDPATLERLTRERDDDFVDFMRRSIGLFQPPGRDRRARLTCPFCQSTMVRKAIGETADDYDVCEQHGVFFDFGELRAFVDHETARRVGTIDDTDLSRAGLGWRWPWS
jgi:ribosomal protein L37AE/L43A